MFTDNDQEARRVLIATHGAFYNQTTKWCKGSYELNIGPPEWGPLRCMMGEIAAQTRLHTGGQMFLAGSPFDLDLFTSIYDWFMEHLPDSESTPELFNDNAGYDAVMQFLIDRIHELDCALSQPERELTLA